MVQRKAFPLHPSGLKLNAIVIRDNSFLAKHANRTSNLFNFRLSKFGYTLNVISSTLTRILGKRRGRRPLGRPRRRREDNSKMDLREVGCECMDWSELAQYRDRWQALFNMVMNLRVP